MLLPLLLGSHYKGPRRVRGKTARATTHLVNVGTGREGAGVMLGLITGPAGHADLPEPDPKGPGTPEEPPKPEPAEYPGRPVPSP